MTAYELSCFPVSSLHRQHPNYNLIRKLYKMLYIGNDSTHNFFSVNLKFSLKLQFPPNCIDIVCMNTCILDYTLKSICIKTAGSIIFCQHFQTSFVSEVCLKKNSGRQLKRFWNRAIILLLHKATCTMSEIRCRSIPAETHCFV